MRHRIAQLHVIFNIALGSVALVYGLLNWESHDPLRFLSFVAAAIFGSVLKVRLPGVTGTMSVSSLFVLVGIVNLSLSETLVVGVISILVQSVWGTSKRPRLVQVSFNVCSLATAIYISTVIFRHTHSQFFEPLSLALLAVNYFCANTFPVAAIIAMTEGKGVGKVWSGYRWMLPFYVVGASMAWLIGTVPGAIQWELPIICLPLIYLVHRSNRTYLLQAEQENAHMLQMNSLHLRTIEALALAIDAKDHTTHDHLQRVQLYAVEIGKDLGLSELELDALRAAAMLHDIGKLAVPESIISKPGKLTRAEFEKMKIHPVVGAEILERVEFPYPVAPIVRAHHEKWNGSGYPYGLRGAEIPIGARILSAVDCLDALASDRQYRRALPLHEAMARVASEAGTSFDPAVVRALQARYQELEGRAKEKRDQSKPSLSVDIKITRGSAPATGFEAEAVASANNVTEIHPVARARVLRGHPRSASLEGQEALAVMALRVEALVAYDAIAFYGLENGFVRARFATGDDRRALNSLRVAEGDGLVGWVAGVAKPILNGNPSVEPGYPQDGSLCSALALPLEDSGRIVGVMALYRRERDAFAADELVSLLALRPDVATILVNIEESTQKLEVLSA